MSVDRSPPQDMDRIPAIMPPHEGGAAARRGGRKGDHSGHAESGPVLTDMGRGPAKGQQHHFSQVPEDLQRERLPATTSRDGAPRCLQGQKLRSKRHLPSASPGSPRIISRDIDVVPASLPSPASPACPAPRGGVNARSRREVLVPAAPEAAVFRLRREFLAGHQGI